MFNSRIDRTGYLLANLYLIAILVAVILTYALFNAFVPNDAGAIRATINILLFVAGAAVIVLYIPINLGAAARRLHDLGLTGWLSVISLIPFVSYVFVLILLFAPGKKGKNPYGLPQSPRDVKTVLLGTK